MIHKVYVILAIEFNIIIITKMVSKSDTDFHK